MGNRNNEIVVRNEAGDLEVIDLFTGEVVVNSNGPQEPLAAFQFSYEKALYVCQLVREGKTMKEITEMPDMPPLHVISHWQRADRMFAEEMKLARKERAEYYHDQAMAIAGQAAQGRLHKDDVPAMALAVKTFQWGAERAKPEAYGAKVTHEGNAEKPILMRVINTGISRGPKPDIVIPDIKEVTDEQSSTTSNSDSGPSGDFYEAEGTGSEARADEEDQGENH